MTKCEEFIEELVNFLVNNPVEDFEMDREDALYYIGYDCENEEKVDFYKKKYIQYIYGNSQDMGYFVYFDTFQELEESVKGDIAGMFSSINVPIINGKVPEHIFLVKKDEEWHVYNSYKPISFTDKKVLWGSEILSLTKRGQATLNPTN